MSAYDEDLDNLDNWMRRLKIEYDVYLSGNRKRPPEDLRARVEKLVHRLSEAASMSYSQRFRYNTLVARYYVYRDLWRRTMTERETGAASPRKAAHSHPAGAKARVSQSPQTLMVSIADPDADQEEIRKIYEAASRINPKHQEGAGALSFEKFSEYISRRARALKEKYGCRSVLFSVSVEGDAIRFTAKPEP